MKNILFQFGVILFCSALIYSQAMPMKQSEACASQHGCTAPDEERAIRQVAEKWKNGYNNGDAAKVASLYAEDAYYLTQHFVTGIVHGRADSREYVQRGVDAGYHIDSIQVISTDCQGSLAYTVGRYESTNAGQKAFGVNIVVLKKTGDRWLIVAHESAVPDPATAIQHLDRSKVH